MPETSPHPTRRCARCETEVRDGAANFCEECGAPLAPVPSAAPTPGNAAAALRTDCPGCACTEPAVDGFCPACGLERVSRARDHFEEARGDVLAAVSDLGRRHPRNEDFFALAGDDAGRVLIAVVCDGVSNSQRPDEASEAAARAIAGFLSAATPERIAADAPARLREAAEEAQAAVMRLPKLEETSPGAGSADGKPLDSPESTLVAALARGREVDLVWLGDSRGYFVGETTAGPAVPLTHDHSWFNAVVDAGKMSAEEAGRSPLAHTLIRSLGGPCPVGKAADEPSVAHFRAPENGWLLLCSDGLWNYARDPETIGHLVRAAVRDAVAAADPQPLRRAARSLVDFALRAGGRDNVTVALARLQG